MKRITLILGILLVLALSGCVTTSASGGIKPDADGIYVLETEAMTLENCKIIDADGASGGKAAIIESPDASGSIEIELPAGDYAVIASINAPDGDADAFYIIANDTFVQRVYPSRHNQWTYTAKFLTFTAEAAGLQTIRFSINWPEKNPGETGMMIDKLELVPMTKSASALQKWQK